MRETILVVDDEEQIRAAVKGVLADEGYHVVEAADGRRALELLGSEQPGLVILDIWMPEVDGIALLEMVKARNPHAEVIVISGHGNIETAVRATKLGAIDFIEKPFSLDSLLQSVRRVLEEREEGERDLLFPTPWKPRAPRASAPRFLRERTIRGSVVAQGVGLHSGVKTGLILHPLPPESGILLGSISLEETIPAHLDYVQSTAYATTLYGGGMVAKTVEHLMAALHGYGITNLLIKMQGEIPALDGSALDFCHLLDSAGIQEQPGEAAEIHVDRPYAVGDVSREEKFIMIEPADRLEIHYVLMGDPPVGRQEYTYVHRGPDSFREEIAPARTFGFLRDLEMLEQMGLANGGRLSNCILIGDNGVVNTRLRFPEEFARHKILDLMGDLYLLGRPVCGRVTAFMTGHTDNIALLHKIRRGLAR